MLTEEPQKELLTSVLRNIKHIADKEYQIRVWILGKGPEADDFDETVNFFFPLFDAILDHPQKFWLTEKQYQTLRKFRDEFEVFSDEQSWPTDFIDTPEWEKIMNLAREVLRAFNYPEPPESKMIFRSQEFFQESEP